MGFVPSPAWRSSNPHLEEHVVLQMVWSQPVAASPPLHLLGSPERRKNLLEPAATGPDPAALHIPGVTPRTGCPCWIHKQAGYGTQSTDMRLHSQQVLGDARGYHCLHHAQQTGFFKENPHVSAMWPPTLREQLHQQVQAVAEFLDTCPKDTCAMKHKNTKQKAEVQPSCASFLCEHRSHGSQDSSSFSVANFG